MTKRSEALFLDLAKDAINWTGRPLFQGDKDDCGNLTQLKKEGYVTAFTDEGCTWITFTDKGVALAAEHNIDLGIYSEQALA